MRGMRSVVLLLMAVFLTGCGRLGDPSDRTMFELAGEAVKADSRFPSGAEIGSLDDAKIEICRNAALVEVPYEFVSKEGQNVTRTYTVWLKNMAHSWQVDRCFPTPTYQAEQ